MGLSGNVAEMGFSLQALRGTPAAVAQHRVRIAGGGFGEMLETQDVIESTGERLLEDSYVASIRAEGQPVFVVRPEFIFLLAYAAMGAKAVDAAAEDPYTHTATLGLTLPWLTVWSQLANGKRLRVADCKVGRFRLESTATGLLRCTTTIIGADPRYKTAAAWTTEVEAVALERLDRFLHADGKGAFRVEGAAVSSIERAVLEVENGVSAQYGDDVTPDDVTVARQTITIETTQTINDFALFNRVHYGSATPDDNAEPTRDVLELGGAPSGVDFKYTRPEATPGAPARSLQYLAPTLQVASLGGLEYNEGGDPIKMAATYRVRKPEAGSGLTLVVVNGHPAYPAL